MTVIGISQSFPIATTVQVSSTKRKVLKKIPPSNLGLKVNIKIQKLLSPKITCVNKSLFDSLCFKWLFKGEDPSRTRHGQRYVYAPKSFKLGIMT